MNIGEPYKIPPGWVLAQLGDLVLNPKGDFVDGPFGSNLKSFEYKTNGIPVFRIQNTVVRQTEIKLNFGSVFRYRPTFQMTFEKQGVVLF